MRGFVLVLICCALNATLTFGQKIISLDQAISMAISNNYGVKISLNDIKVAENNYSSAKSSFMPTVDVSSNGDYANNHGFDGEKADNNFSGNLGLNVNWSIYEGGGRRFRLQMLNEEKNIADLEHRNAVEQLITNVTDTYFSASQLLEQIKTQEVTLNISRDRLNRALVANQYANNTSLDVLNARVDFNQDSVALMNYHYDYDVAKYQLLELIKDEWDSEIFDVEIIEEGFARFNLSNLLEKTKENNVQVLMSEASMESSRYEYKIQKSKTRPSLSLSRGYTYSYQSPFIDQIESSRGSFNANLSLKIPIFDAGQRKINVKNAQLRLKNQELRSKQTLLQIEKQLRVNYASYENKLQNIFVETNNLKAARLNLEISRELLNNGQITNVQFRDSQRNLLELETNILRSKFELKKLEYIILSVSGQLVGYVGD